MVFSSLIFLFAFLPIFFTLYYLVPAKCRNMTALLGSCFFYAWGAPRFLFILLAGCAIDYALSRGMQSVSAPLRVATPDGSTKGERQKRWLLVISLIINVGLLAYFKYANFFVDQLNAVFQRVGASPVSWASIALPIGISFFTFHKISYIVDVYRGVVRPARTFGDFLLYILLFPQLIAGPIIRYHDIAEQIESRRLVTTKEFEGIIRFSLGLGKKVLIANYLGQVADSVFAMPTSTLHPLVAWIGISAYAFQIYFDFSGYSDMAIGLGRLLGFRFLENFNHPYIAQNFTEFWRRWHISLSHFMKEYLYIPLGGNRGPRWRMYVNLWIVFLLSGMWHGANWTFVVWGAYHGFFLVLDKIFLVSLTERIPKVINTAVTFLLVTIGWVFFRSDTLGQAIAYLGRMFSFGAARYSNEVAVILADMVTHRTWAMFVAAALISFIPIFHAPRRVLATIREEFHPYLVVSVEIIGVLSLYGLSILSLFSAQFNPFIYFRF